nr:efflux RND transporter periplasmic adaptor subunit [Pseudaminobacter soli]
MALSCQRSIGVANPVRYLAATLLVLLLATSSASAQAQQDGERPPPAVVVQPIPVEEVANPEQFNGRVEAIETVDIRARVQGFLRAVDFTDGQSVKQGDTLFEIEPDEFQAAVASAQAQVARAEASRGSAERTLTRNRELFAQKTVSQSALDQAQAAFEIAVADVQVAQAALRTAMLNLSYTRITAPISGRIGKPAFTQGNLVGPESGVLARIVSLDPIRVAFSITEGFLVTLRQKAAQQIELDPSELDFSLRLANGTDYVQPGRLDYVENEVDPQTGTVTTRLTFPNPNRILMPGQFVTLNVREKNAPRLPVVPQSAVLQDREGRYVYLLNDDDTVSQRRIETGARVGAGWAVTKGLSGGEQVVVQGVQRLADGMKVQPSQQQAVGQ